MDKNVVTSKNIPMKEKFETSFEQKKINKRILNLNLVQEFGGNVLCLQFTSYEHI